LKYYRTEVTDKCVKLFIQLIEQVKNDLINKNSHFSVVFRFLFTQYAFKNNHE